MRNLLRRYTGVIEKTPLTARVYIVFHGQNQGYNYMVTRYDFIPRITNETSWYLNFTIQEWASILREKYDYVFLGAIDKEFIDKFKFLFQECSPESSENWEVKRDPSAEFGIKLLPYKPK